MYIIRDGGSMDKETIKITGENGCRTVLCNNREVTVVFFPHTKTTDWTGIWMSPPGGKPKVRIDYNFNNGELVVHTFSKSGK